MGYLVTQHLVTVCNPQLKDYFRRSMCESERMLSPCHSPVDLIFFTELTPLSWLSLAQISTEGHTEGACAP